MSIRDRERFHRVCCPSCFQEFEIAGPAPEECPTEWDYDCEVCCRPMLIAFTVESGLDETTDEVVAEARSLEE